MSQLKGMFFEQTQQHVTLKMHVFEQIIGLVDLYPTPFKFRTHRTWLHYILNLRRVLYLTLDIAHSNSTIDNDVI